MVVKKGSVVRLANGKNYLVDDIKTINGIEYIVFMDLQEATFHIGMEEQKGNNLAYNFLNQEDSIRIAKEIDKIDHKDE
ncbi:MAG: hypothetical protein IJA61_04295 [Clostridia bacterium]|nr:hypothetical protein [Clostridia bacterium]